MSKWLKRAASAEEAAPAEEADLDGNAHAGGVEIILCIQRLAMVQAMESKLQYTAGDPDKLRDAHEIVLYAIRHSGDPAFHG